MTFFQRLLLSAAVALAGTTTAGCDFNLDDPNTVGEDTVFNTVPGLLGAAIGLQELYNVQALGEVIINPAVTARELAANTTFANLLELEDGGAVLRNTNGDVGDLFLQLNRVIGYAENIGEGARATENLTDAQESGLVALSSFYRAVAIGSLAQSFEQVPIATDDDGEASYVSNQAGFAEAARLLDEAEGELATSGAAGAIPTPVGFDLLNTIRAYRARYELYAGNDRAAIDAADSVDEGATSVFVYTDAASNPLFTRLVRGNSSYAARDDLGLPSTQDGDARIAFYVTEVDSLSTNGLAIDQTAGFADDGQGAPYPAFLPGELDLIRAEAYLNLGDTDRAVEFIDAVRTKTADEDPFGVGAGLDAYDGATDAASLRAEIFYQRGAELYLQGLRLIDSRRLGGPGPGNGPFERNRNFYPYPFQERNANPNTPTDPSI